jgi:hypothetical protein
VHGMGMVPLREGNGSMRDGLVTPRRRDKRRGRPREGQGQGSRDPFRSAAFIEGCADVRGGGQTLSATAQSSRSTISVSGHWTWEKEAKKDVVAPGESETDRREIFRVLVRFG